MGDLLIELETIVRCIHRPIANPAWNPHQGMPPSKGSTGALKYSRSRDSPALRPEDGEKFGRGHYLYPAHVLKGIYVFQVSCNQIVSPGLQGAGQYLIVGLLAGDDLRHL